MSLTDTVIRAAKATGKYQKLHDANGLYLHIAPVGSKTWRLKYRFGGKEKTLTLEPYPQMSLKEAREKRDEAKKQIANGIDPSALKQQVKGSYANAVTLEFVAREWHGKQKPTWSARHADDVIERLEKNIFPFLGKRPPNEITPPELLAVLRKIEGRGAIEVAHRVRGICSQVFRYAVAIGLAERDPAADLVGAIQTRPIIPRAAITEPKEVGALMRAIDGFSGTYIVKCALQLAA
ncbi:MAG: Prophage integrase IntS [Desulfovibrio sp.]